jgi:hypothetical protein
MVANPHVRALTPQERKQFEDVGEAFVRQACNGNFYPNGHDGSPHPMKVAALIWLAEIDEEARKRTEALQASEMALARSTLKAAWIAAGAAIIAIVVGILTWLFPLH